MSFILERQQYQNFTEIHEKLANVYKTTPDVIFVFGFKPILVVERQLALA
jgi:hypothetical protein